MGHKLPSGSIVWSRKYIFKSPPVPGESSLQRVVIFGDMGKVHTTVPMNKHQQHVKCHHPNVKWLPTSPLVESGHMYVDLPL